MSEELRAKLKDLVIPTAGIAMRWDEAGLSSDDAVDQIEQAFKDAGWHPLKPRAKLAVATLKAKYGDDYFSKLAARGNTSRKIHDEHTDKPVSRQRKWQLRHPEQQEEARRKYRTAKRAAGLES